MSTVFFLPPDEGQGEVYQGGQEKESHRPQINRIHHEGEDAMKLL